MKSNIQVRSNIYPADPEMFKNLNTAKKETLPETVHLSIQKFLKQIRGKSALKKLSQHIHGNTGRDNLYRQWLEQIGIQSWQIELYWDLDTPCVYAKPNHPHGLISEGTIGCKCENHDCFLFDKKLNQCKG